MAVTLTGAEGFFTRQGAIVGEYNRVSALYGSALDAGFLSIWTQFASADQQAVENLPSAVTSFRNSGGQYSSTLLQDGMLAALLQVSRTESVVPYSLAQALTVVRNQMVLTAQSINRPTLGSSVASGSLNDGDATIAVSTTNIYGDPLDMTLPETFTVSVLTQGNPYAGSMQAVGEAMVPPNAYNWPQGSGGSASFTILDPAANGLTSDGGFALWGGAGSNTPTRWDIINGAAGTTIFKSAGGGVRTGTDAAQITSDGAAATQLEQTIVVLPNTVYAVCFWAKINTLTATGTFRIAFTDENGVLLTNDAGASLAYTRNLNGEITTAYQLFTAFFSTPRILPTNGVKIRVGTSAFATSGRIITFDLVGVIAATPLYGLQGTGTSGPFMSGFAGINPSAVGDTYTAAFTNDLTTQSFVFGLERLYGTRNLGVYMPSAISETIPDSLVTH